MSNPQKGKWFKFNDTVVEEFEMTEDSLEAECFGGTYKAKILEPSKTSLSISSLEKKKLPHVSVFFK